MICYKNHVYVDSEPSSFFFSSALGMCSVGGRHTLTFSTFHCSREHRPSARAPERVCVCAFSASRERTLYSGALMNAPTLDGDAAAGAEQQSNWSITLVGIRRRSFRSERVSFHDPSSQNLDARIRLRTIETSRKTPHIEK